MEFEAIVGSNDAGTNCVLPLPFDPKEAFGRARAPVVVAIDGHEPFRTTIAVYGGVGIVGLRKAQSAAFGIAPGDRVQVRITPDTAPRTVEVPPELAAALAAHPDATAAYERLSHAHRREYASWIAEAKKQETRDRRATRAVEMLLAGTRTPR